MNANAYSILEKKVQSGELEIISILAPARSSSTALERALLESPDIDMQINDPWAIYDEATREEKTYDYILNRIETTDNVRVVLIKNIADYIPPGACWARWCALVKSHVFLIRNPLLTTHSLLKMVVKHYEGKDCLFPEVSMDEYAKEKGFKDWNALRSYAVNENEFFILDDFYKIAFPEDQKIHQEPVMKEPVLSRLLDADYNSAGFLNNNERAFAYRITGWEALFQHIQDVETPLHIIDSTIYRAHPDLVMERLSQALGIGFSVNTLKWSDEGRQQFNTDYDEDVPYYQRVETAKGIEPPTEQPLPLNRFPPYFHHHLTAPRGAFDIYLQLLSQVQPMKWNDDLYQADPVFRFALDTVFRRGNPKELALEYPEFKDMFDAIIALRI